MINDPVQQLVMKVGGGYISRVGILLGYCGTRRDNYNSKKATLIPPQMLPPRSRLDHGYLVAWTYNIIVGYLAGHVTRRNL